MNNKEFIGALSEQTNHSLAETEELVNHLISSMVCHLKENDSINITGFGIFEVKKKMERISVNPTTGKRYLVPPKLTLSFKQSNVLKSKLNGNPS